MDKLTKSRSSYRRQVTRLTKELGTLAAATPMDLSAIRVKFETIQKAYFEMQKLDKEILEKMVSDGTDDDVIDAEVESTEEYTTKFETSKITMDNIFSASPLTGSVQIYNRSFKLPKIELKTFNGDLKEWLGFWSQFEKIDTDGSLHASDKMQYLVQAMEPNSEAQEIVLSYPQSGDNYSKAVEALRRRYGDQDLLLQVYVRELLNLVVSNVTATQKIPLSKMYLRLESHLRSLKSLNLEKADPATWLYPLVESSLSEDVLLAWQRSPLSSKDGSQENPPRTRLDLLMEFLETEVQIKQKITLAQSSFQIEDKKSEMKGNLKRDGKVPTLSSFHNGEMNSCVFCGKGHDSKDCYTARSMTIKEKAAKLRDRKCCYTCFHLGHITNNCKAFLNCIVCGGRHLPIMCPELERKTPEDKPRKSDDESEGSEGGDVVTEVSAGMSNHVCSGQVLLQTLMVEVCGNEKKKMVRVLIDSGSHRSYILKKTAEELGIQACGKEEVPHSLFGGTLTKAVTHNNFKIDLRKPGGGTSIKITARDQDTICNGIPRISRSAESVFQELKEKKIWISDVGDEMPQVEILLGADVWGGLLTGKIVQLDCGLTAMETCLGWTISGETKGRAANSETVSMTVINMSVNDVHISDLQRLETLGNRDPVEVQTAAEKEAETRECLVKTIKLRENERYVVGLPWAKGYPPLQKLKESAYLPFCGCLPEELRRSKWWEGPAWLREAQEVWPNTEEIPNEDDVLCERNKSSPQVTIATTMCVLDGIRCERTHDQAHHATGIRSMNDSMRRTGGKGTLTKAELENVVDKVEEVMNEPSLMYEADSPDDPVPLTPAMFLRLAGNCAFPEEALLTEKSKMQQRWKYVQTLKEEIRERFRRKYLSLLVMKQKEKPTCPLVVVEVVIVGSNGKKRIDWPLGRILELVPGMDGICRVAKVKTTNGILETTVQRLHPLEINTEHRTPESDCVKTRYGRTVKVPDRFVPE